MPMNEIELTPVGKLFVASIVAWLNSDSKLNWNLHGDLDVVKAFTDAVIASKEFQEKVKSSSSTVDDIIMALNKKNTAAKNFETISGKKWPI
jgi:hypothetical protein